MVGVSGGECVLGVDIGTTGARGVAFSLDGTQLHATSAEYPLHSPHPGWAEQEPEAVLEAATGCLRMAAAWAKAQGLSVRAVGLSAILHSLIPVDAQGEALGPSMIWADTRSAPQAAEIRREVDPLALYSRVGGPVHPMYSSAKLRWLRAHRPEVFQRAASFVGIKEYVVRKWTGLHVCDRSVASGTGLFNGRLDRWDDEALAVSGITADRLPPVVETAEPVSVPPERLRALGLPDDCAVVLGGGDGVLQTIGSGTVEPGQMVAMVATSGAIRSVVDAFQTDAEGRTWCYYLASGKWVVGAAINNAGIVYAWLRDQLAHGAPGSVEITDLNRWAEEIKPGSDGLVFLPYLAGERSPNWNANARGLLFGLSLAHDYRHLSRATLEAVAYRMRTIFDPMEDVAGAAHEIRAAGGFIKSPLWLQIVADVLGKPLKLVDTPEASALGAAQLAMLGTGIVKRFEDLAPMVSTIGTVTPDPQRQALYNRLYAIYRKLYESALPRFDEIAALQAELSEQG
jgi:gluconokinase